MDEPPNQLQMKFPLSLFTSKTDFRPRLVERTWSELCSRFEEPQVRAKKDGPLFSPATFVAKGTHKHKRWEDGSFYDCDKDCRRLELVTELSMLVLDCDHDVVSMGQLRTSLCGELMQSGVNCAFAIYSTHSHRQVTESNPNAEPRYRIVMPLDRPVPVERFLRLWSWFADCEQLHVDPQAKDPSRMYYTPAIARTDAPYEFCINDGEPLDWRLLIGDGPSTDQKAYKSEASEESLPRSPGKAASDLDYTPSAVSHVPDIYSDHDVRQAELCRRIMAEAKRNSRGNYEMRCKAHKGKGKTSLVYFPHNNAVHCNNECDYFAILRSFSLPDHVIRQNQHLSSATTPLRSPTAESPRPPDTSAAPPSGSMVQPITNAKIHVINALLLAHCFDLSDDDKSDVQKHWGDPFSESIEWPGTDEALRIKVCSFPSVRLQLEAAKRLSQEFNLEGVPGFYRVLDQPGPDGAQRRATVAEFGPWRLSLPTMKAGALLAPYDNGTGFILGIRIFRNVKDTVPFLMTSRGLPSGASAVGYRREDAA